MHTVPFVLAASTMAPARLLAFGMVTLITILCCKLIKLNDDERREKQNVREDQKRTVGCFTTTLAIVDSPTTTLIEKLRE